MILELGACTVPVWVEADLRVPGALPGNSAVGLLALVAVTEAVRASSVICQQVLVAEKKPQL